MVIIYLKTENVLADEMLVADRAFVGPVLGMRPLVAIEVLTTGISHPSTAPAGEHTSYERPGRRTGTSFPSS